MKIRDIAKQSPLEEGAISNKILPGLSFADAGIRVAEKDYPGAAIAGTAAGLSLIPTIPTQGASIGLEVFNQLRDEAARRGGWKNLGRDMMKSVGDGDFDHIHMLPEDFAKLDQLEESGQLDEGGLSSIPGWIAKYGDDAVRWLKTVGRRDKPDVPTAPKPPLSAAEREAAERAEELAAREAEKRAKVVDRRGQPKQDEVPIINKDAPAAPAEPYPKYDPKVHGSKEDYLKNLNKDQFDRYKATQELLSKEGPVKPGWIQRAGKWVLDNKGKTTAALGTGYMITPSYITDPIADVFKKATGAATEITIDKAQKATQDALEKNRQEKEKFERERGIREPDESQQVSPDETPLEKERREKGWPQSQLNTSPIAERRTIEQRYKDFLQEAETPKYTKEQYIGWAKKYAEQFDVPLPIVLHAMFKETGWLGDPERMRTAKSPTGARGVMQIQPEYAEKGAYKIKVKDLTDPEKNIEAGVRGLAYYFNKYKSPEKALAAYNAGEGGASTFLKTGDVNTLRTQETKKYIQGYKDDVVHQLEKFFPKNKQKVAQVATDVLATVVGAGNAQAADEVPVGTGGPEKPIKIKTYGKTEQLPPAPSAAEIARINKRLAAGQVKDPVKELEKIIAQADAAGQKTDDLKRQVEKLRTDYEKEKTAGPVQTPDDPKSTYINLGPVRLKVDRKDPPKFPSIQSDIPSSDYQSQGDAAVVKSTKKSADKTSQSQQSASGRAQPYVGPQSVKSDSDLSKPAKGVSTATVPPKSEKPADKTNTDAAEKAAKDAAAAEKAAANKKNQQRAAVADVPDANATAKVNVRKEFEKAFAAARAKQVQDTGKGSGGTFTWTNPRTGKEGTFTTDYGDEVKSKAKKAANVSVPDITSKDTQDLASRASQFKAEPNEIEKIIKDRLDKEVKSNSSVDIDPNAVDSGNTNSLPPAIVTAKPDQANVLRSTDGTPVTSGTGEPWGTGTSTKDDLERAKAELQKKIDDEKAKKELQKISPDLSEPAAQDSFQDKWSRGIEWLTGKKIPDPKEMDKIRVPESVNTELKDILWLAGRTKK